MPRGDARFNTTCRVCGKSIRIGDDICWGKSKARHYICPDDRKTDIIPLESEETDLEEILEDNTAITYETEETDSVEETEPVTVSKPKPAINGNLLAESIAESILPYLEDRLSSKVDSESLQDAVNATLDGKLDRIADSLKDRLTTRIEITNRETREVKKLDTVHKLFPTLLHLLQVKHVWVYGAAGGGKTTVAQQVAEALDLPFYCISIVAQTQPSALLGYSDAYRELLRTPFREAYEHGGVFLIDEISAGTGNFLTILNGALDNGHCAFPDGIIKRHKDFICIAADNTAGNGASHLYNGRNKLDAATRERFLFLEWEYDEVLERSIALSFNPKAGAWVSWIQGVRGHIARLNVPVIASPRASIEGAQLLLNSELSLDYILNATLFKGVDKDTQSKILASAGAFDRKGVK